MSKYKSPIIIFNYSKFVWKKIKTWVHTKSVYIYKIIHIWNFIEKEIKIIKNIKKKKKYIGKYKIIQNSLYLQK